MNHHDVIVRTYVLYPYRMVRDHLVWIKRDDPQEVLDGDLDEFIRASMILRAKHRAACGSDLPAGVPARNAFAYSKWTFL